MLIAFLLKAVVLAAVLMLVTRIAKRRGIRPFAFRRQGKDLSAEQKVDFVKAILEESLIVNDRAYDALMNEGEGEYAAAEACKCSGIEFDLQYGSKRWITAWKVALTYWFDCQSEYVGKGMFLVYGKEV